MDDEIQPDQSLAVRPEQSLQRVTLEHALAFKDTSAELFSNTISDIKRLSEGNHNLYQGHFPRSGDSDEADNIRVTPAFHNDGKLTQAEAAALQILITEHSALNQAPHNDEVTQKMMKILRMNPNYSINDVLDGIAKFGNFLGNTATSREQLINELGNPKEFWDGYSEAIKADQLTLGEHTSQAVFNYIMENIGENSMYDPQIEQSQEKLKARVDSYHHGVKLAQELYNEAREKAAQQLPSTLSPNIQYIESDSNQNQPARSILEIIKSRFH